VTKLKWVLAGVAALAVLVLGGTWVYINVIRDDAPPPLALTDDGSESSSGDAATTTVDDAPGTTLDEPTGGIAGTWTATDGSIAGYRVEEILFGQSVEAVGRTSDVEGLLEVDGTTVTTATFTVDMTTVESDEDRRDGQFRGRIMDVDTHPTATLSLVEPIVLDAEPAEGDVIAVTALVELTLRGVTRQVEMDLEARRAGDTVEIVGGLPIVFADWEIPNPSVPGIETEDEGVLEVLLVLERTS
jgi:polyisoprenoid-binding protein YceI